MTTIESIPVGTAVNVCSPASAPAGDLLPNVAPATLQQCTLACASTDGCTLFEYNKDSKTCPTFVEGSKIPDTCDEDAKTYYQVLPGADKIVGDLGPKPSHFTSYGDKDTAWTDCRRKCLYSNSSCASYTVDGDGEGCSIVLDWAPDQPGRSNFDSLMSGLEPKPKAPVLDDHGPTSQYATLTDSHFDAALDHYINSDSNHGPGGFTFTNTANPLSCTNNIGGKSLKTIPNRSVQECAYSCKQDSKCQSFMASSDGTCDLFDRKCGAKLLGEVKEDSSHSLYFSKVSNTRSQSCSTVKDLKVIAEPGHGAPLVADTGSCGVHGDCIFPKYSNGSKCMPMGFDQHKKCSPLVTKGDCDKVSAQALLVTVYPCDWSEGDTKTAVSLSPAWERTWSNKDYQAKFIHQRPVTLQACRQACLDNKDCKTFKYWLNGGCQLSDQDCTGDVVFDDKNPIRMMADYPQSSKSPFAQFVNDNSKDSDNIVTVQG